MRSFLMGVGIGAALGMLLAPASGSEVRNDLTERAGDLADTAREAMEQGRERVRSSMGRGGEATGTA